MYCIAFFYNGQRWGSFHIGLLDISFCTDSESALRPSSSNTCSRTPSPSTRRNTSIVVDDVGHRTLGRALLVLEAEALLWTSSNERLSIVCCPLSDLLGAMHFSASWRSFLSLATRRRCFVGKSGGDVLRIDHAPVLIFRHSSDRCSGCSSLCVISAMPQPASSLATLLARLHRVLLECDVVPCPPVPLLNAADLAMSLPLD